MTDLLEEKKLIAEFDVALQRSDVDELDKIANQIVRHTRYYNSFQFPCLLGRRKQLYKLLIQYYAFGLKVPCPDMHCSKEELRYKMLGLRSDWYTIWDVGERDRALKTYKDDAELCLLLKSYYHVELQFVEFYTHSSRFYYTKEKNILDKEFDHLSDRIYNEALNGEHLELLEHPGLNHDHQYKCSHPLTELLTWRTLWNFETICSAKTPQFIRTKDLHDNLS